MKNNYMIFMEKMDISKITIKIKSLIIFVYIKNVKNLKLNQ